MNLALVASAKKRREILYKRENQTVKQNSIIEKGKRRLSMRKAGTAEKLGKRKGKNTETYKCCQRILRQQKRNSKKRYDE